MATMISFTATLYQFEEQGEKTGWTYIDIPADMAHQLKPNTRKSFRVKGKIDDFVITAVALVPMGAGNFIMAINASMRKGIKKGLGAMVQVAITEDTKGYELNSDFVTCLKDALEALTFFNTLTKGHQNYYSKWIDDAKTEPTRVKRITMAVSGLSQQMDYGTMIRYFRDNKI